MSWIPVAAVAKAFTELREQDLTCCFTGHLVGTDTWPDDYWCECKNCQQVKELARRYGDEELRRRAEDARLNKLIDRVRDA